MEKWDAAFYEEATIQFLDKSKKLIEEFKGRMNWDEQEEVLDFGCGPGSITKEILFYLPRRSKLVGFDKSEEMIQHAKRHYENSQLEFVNGDLLADNLIELIGKERFTKVYSFHAFHLLVDQRKALECIKKVMKPGGQALLSLVSDGGMYHIYQMMAKERKWRKYMVNKNNCLTPYHNMASPEEVFAELLDSAGFKVIECTARPTSVSEPKWESLKNIIKSSNPFLIQIPEELQEEFMEDLMQCGLKNGFVNKIHYTHETMYVLPYQLIIGFFQKPDKEISHVND